MNDHFINLITFNFFFRPSLPILIFSLRRTAIKRYDEGWLIVL